MNWVSVNVLMRDLLQDALPFGFLDVVWSIEDEVTCSRHERLLHELFPAVRRGQPANFVARIHQELLKTVRTDSLWWLSTVCHGQGFKRPCLPRGMLIFVYCDPGDAPALKGSSLTQDS